MTAPNRPPLCDPVDRPESYPLGYVTTEEKQRARARLAIMLAGQDPAERHQFLQMLDLNQPDEIRTQLHHRA